MALTIWNKTRNKEHNYHVQSFKELRYSNISLTDDYFMIQADGHELTHILNNFVNIPKLAVDSEIGDNTSRGYVMRWFGDDAKFIIANI